MAMNSLGIAKSFKIFENQMVSLFVTSDFKMVQIFV